MSFGPITSPHGVGLQSKKFPRLAKLNSKGLNSQNVRQIRTSRNNPQGPLSSFPVKGMVEAGEGETVADSWNNGRTP
ncbi:hypothetical protein QE152_g36817 [Popillia japonica]|uniref:Uncharacterized protein n=1 Tax=Popillia japonica TaxID=7064 RepID=A0AAW1IC52_POPJA